MAATDLVTSISGLAGLSPAAAAFWVPSADTSASPAPEPIMNDPIMDIKLLVSLPANLGSRMDLSA